MARWYDSSPGADVATAEEKTQKRRWYDESPEARSGVGEKMTAFGEQAVFGAERSGAVMTGAGLGIAAGALTGPAAPFGIPAGGAIGAYAGQKVADWWLAGKKGLDDYSEDERPFAVAGMVFGEIAPMTGVVTGVAKAGHRTGGPLMDKILGMAERSPGPFITSEVSGAIGASVAAGVSEDVLPGNELARAGATVVGGFLSPTRLAVGPFKGAYESARFFFHTRTKTGRLNEASRIIQLAVTDGGGDPAEVAALLRKAGFTEEWIRAKEGIDIAQTAAQKTGDIGLARMEKMLSMLSAEFGAEAKKRFDDTIHATKVLMYALETSGDPRAIKDAAVFREQYFRTLLLGRLQAAEDEATRAAKAITQNSPEDISPLSSYADTLLTKALRDARQVESDLWNKIPGNISAPASRILATVEEIRKTPLILPTQKLPPEIDAFIEKLAKAAKKAGPNATITTSGELKVLRSTALSLAKKYKAEFNGPYEKISNMIAESAREEMSHLPLVSKEYDEARAWSKSLNDVFTRAFAGTAHATNKRGGMKITPEELMEKALAGGATRSNIRLQELEKAISFLPDKLPKQFDHADLAAFKDIQERLVRLSAAEAVDPLTGRVNAKRLETFLNKNAVLFNRFPEAKRDLRAAIDTELKLKDVQRTLDGASRIIQKKAAFAKIVQREGGLLAEGTAKTVIEPYDVVRKAFTSKEPERELIRLARLANRAEDKIGAQEGLVATVWEYAVKRHGTEFNPGELYKSIFVDPMTPGGRTVGQILIKEGLLTKKQAESMANLYAELDKVMSSVVSQKEVGALAEQFVRGVDPLFDLGQRLIGAKVGQKMSELGPGQGMGSSLVMASAGVRFTESFMAKVPVQRIRDLLIEASLNPEFAAMLLENPSTQREVFRLHRQIHAYLIQAGLTAIEDVTGMSDTGATLEQ